MSKFSKSLVTTVVVFALSAPVVASAAPMRDLDGTAIKVSYSELNLDKEEGAIVLYKRLQIAARQVCSVRTLTLKGSLHEAAERKACYRDTLDAAVSKVDNQYVNKLHSG